MENNERRFRLFEKYLYIDGDEYEIVKKIGSGTTGTVYLIVNVIDNTKTYVMKLSNRKCEQDLCTELNNIIINLEPNDIKSFPIYYGFTDVKRQSIIIYPYLGDNNLDNYKLLPNLSFDDKKNIIKNLCEQLNILIFKKLVHGDFKPGNICIDTSNNFSIIDFGLLVNLNSDYADIRSTIYCMSPEALLTHQKYYKFIDNGIKIDFSKHDYFGMFSIILTIFSKYNAWYLLSKYFNDINISEIKNKTFVYFWYKLNYKDKSELTDVTLLNLINHIEEKYNYNEKKFPDFEQFFNFISPHLDSNKEFIKNLLKEFCVFEPNKRKTLNNIISLYL
jgi:serine/threonine protein kinase